MSSNERAPTFTVANFNLHAGIDGWGRPFDVVAACRALDADVVVLEECWTPAGRPEAGQAVLVASALGYAVVEEALATGRRAAPHEGADHRWMRSWDWRGGSHAIYLDGERPLGRRTSGSARFQTAESGAWGIAVLSRLPVVDRAVVELGRLPRDRARRVVLVTVVDVGGTKVTVAGTHMSHLSYGSPVHFRRLGAILGALPAVGDGPDASPGASPDGSPPVSPVVLVGDMNLWGPPTWALLGGRRCGGGRWRRAVRGRTWPAWRPHSQLDHILVRGPLTVEHAEVLPMAGSDHRPVRARLALDGSSP
jgi:endonuclease/exonuclease/phosphatase family metal-dependent hydrolase